MIIQIKKILLKYKLMLLGVVISIAVQICISAAFPYLTKFIVDEVLLKRQLDKLKMIVLLSVTLIILQIPINVTVSYLCSKWSQLFIFELRKNISQFFFRSKENPKKNGLFINTITNDCELIGSQLLNITISSLPNILLIVVYLAILLRLSAILVGIILAGLPLFVLIAYITSRKIFALTKDLQHYRDKLVEFLNSHVRNKLLIDLYGLKEEEEKNFFNISKQLKNVNIKTNTIVSFLNNLSSLIAVITPLVTLLVGSFLVINNQLSLGSLITFNTYTVLIFGPIGKLLTIPPMISQLKVSIERINDIEFSEIIYKKGRYSQSAFVDQQLLSVSDFIPYIEKNPLLTTQLNFILKRGELLRITGKNGIGKSVLLQCLVNYHENFVGHIKIDKGITIIYVPQENFLFEGTIKDNLTKGLSEYDIQYLYYLVNRFNFKLPLDQKVTPFSLSLSSGQLQKIKLIRALLSKPNILILDEVFANLDHETTTILIDYLKQEFLTTIFTYHGEMSHIIQRNDYTVLDLDCYVRSS